MTDSKKPLIVYIGGYGRSGSTLLDVLLGSHPQAVSLGEVRYAQRHIDRGVTVCGCGSAADACSLWGDQRVKSTLAAYHATRSRSLLEGWWGYLLAIRAAGAGSYGATTFDLYHALAETAEADVLVDSSKTAGGARSRPYLLHRLAGLPVKLVHLSRDPRSVNRSVRSGSNEARETGEDLDTRFAGLRGTLGWLFANLAALLAGWLIGRDNYLRLRYEDLIAEPEASLRRLWQFSGLEPHIMDETLERGPGLTPAHVIGGNRMSRSGSVRVRPRRPAPPDTGLRDALIWISTLPVALLLGHPFRSAGRGSPH